MASVRVRGLAQLAGQNFEPALDGHAGHRRTGKGVLFGNPFQSGFLIFSQAKGKKPPLGLLLRSHGQRVYETVYRASTKNLHLSIFFLPCPVVSAKKTNPVPIRLDENLLAKAKSLAEKFSMTQADLFRLAMNVGLDAMALKNKPPSDMYVQCALEIMRDERGVWKKP